jgi:hypothetical protein
VVVVDFKEIEVRDGLSISIKIKLGQNVKVNFTMLTYTLKK